MEDRRFCIDCNLEYLNPESIKEGTYQKDKCPVCGKFNTYKASEKEANAHVHPIFRGVLTMFAGGVK